MKYYIANPELDRQIKEIRAKIRLSMNGIVSDQMTQNGIIYKKNYGVDIPRIKEISKLYAPNHDLAQRLWNLKIRETMIMATLLEPVDKFTEEIAQEWAESFNQIEIVEQAGMNLFSKLPYATSLSLKWIHSDKMWMQISGYIVAARVSPKFNQNETAEIVQNALKSAATNELHLYKAIALCLSRCCRNSKEAATYILKEIDAFSQSPSIAQRYIYSEVKQEILFLNIL
ncbi:MAG TPA: DNA alkylation repair protein [Paludibacter sp.]|nr:DNA alkylation repair protein [Paludibacter sp.]